MTRFPSGVHYNPDSRQQLFKFYLARFLEATPNASDAELREELIEEIPTARREYRAITKALRAVRKEKADARGTE
jgi:hypothetical protein